MTAMTWWKRQEREEDLERELHAHLEQEAEERRQDGLSGEDARFAACRTLGNTTRIKEETRAMWRWAAFDPIAKDLRYAFRSLRKNAVFSAAAILSLALGIGANTAIFSLIDALLLRSLPVPSPGELLQLQIIQLGRPGTSFGYPTIVALAGLTDIFEGVGGFTSVGLNVVSSEGVERVSGAWVTGGFYRTLGLEPFAGRLLTLEDDRPGAPPVAVIAYSYWENRFARDFAVVGRPIVIDGTPVTIVGISPRGFTGATVGEAANFTLPFSALPQIFPERARQLESGSQWIRVLARLAPGVSVSQAKARLAVAWPQMAVVATTPRMRGDQRQAILTSTIDLAPGATGDSGLRNRFRQSLVVLMAITGLVLLIASANFANLLLARGASRSKEIALRFAIGAGRGRIVRQLLTESLTLSSAGAVFGIGLAMAGSRMLVALMPGRQAVMLDLRPDALVLLFTTAIALITGIVFGLLPAWKATAMGPGAALKADAGITPRTRSRLLPTLVVSQVAVSLVLLFGAGLFVRTLQNLEQIDPGFRSEGVLLVNLDARRGGYTGTRLIALYQELLGQFQRLPGVVSASISNNTPLNGGIWSGYVSINGQPFTKETAHNNIIGPHYFETMGTPLVLGRDFDEHDGPNTTPSAIVNEAFVRKFIPDGHPLGQQVSTSIPTYPPFQIVGVVRDTVSQSLREKAPPFLYLPYLQILDRGVDSSGNITNSALATATYEIRISGSMARTAALLRDQMREKFPGTPGQILIEGMTEQVNRTLVQERLLAALGACFGALALVLAAVGLYGLLAYTVARSTSEIGIRMALGARRSEVLGLILRAAMKLLTAGVIVGVPAAWAASRVIAAMLFGLTPVDPVTTLAATALLGAAVLFAALLPALRASRVDPMVALRYE